MTYASQALKRFFPETSGSSLRISAAQLNCAAGKAGGNHRKKTRPVQESLRIDPQETLRNKCKNFILLLAREFKNKKREKKGSE